MSGGNTVVIVGSGVLGSALATVLADSGRDVTVIERSMKPPDRVNGEVLQAGGINALRDLGIDECLLSTDGVPLQGVRMSDTLTGNSVVVPFSDGEEALSFSNGKFVDALRQRAQAEKRCTYIEGSVSSVIEEGDKVVGVVFCRKGSDTKEELRAKLTVVADGGYSRLRKVNVSGTPTKYGTVVSILYKGSLVKNSTYGVGNSAYHAPYYCTPENSVYLNHLSENVLRYSAVINEQNYPDDIRGFMKKQLKYIEDELRQPILDCIDDAPIVKANTLGMATQASFQMGVITLGDALNMRHHLTAAGMTVALKDIIIWRKLLDDIPDLDDMEAMRAAHETFLMKRREHTFVPNVMALVMASLLYPSDNKGLLYRSATIDYLGWSSKAQKDMGRMLSIMETRPWLLLYHLTAATMFTACRIVGQERWWSLPRGLLRSASYVYETFSNLLSLFLIEGKSQA